MKNCLLKRKYSALEIGEAQPTLRLNDQEKAAKAERLLRSVGDAVTIERLMA
jgi:hypothetical protein